jgi:nitrate reductase NapAB chaperone NapD
MKKQLQTLSQKLAHLESSESETSKLGELIVQIEADLKRRVAECTGQINALSAG